MANRLKNMKAIGKIGIAVLVLSCVSAVAMWGRNGLQAATASMRNRQATTRKETKAHEYSVLNDGTSANTALVFEESVKPGPEKTAWLIVSRGNPNNAKTLYARELGGGSAGKVEVGDFTEDGKQEVFVFVDGQKTSAEMLRFKGNKATVLYRLGGGRPYVFLRYRDTKGGCVADIVEQWPAFQLGIENSQRFKGHKVAQVVFRWNGTKYEQHHIEPADRWVDLDQ